MNERVAAVPPPTQVRFVPQQDASVLEHVLLESRQRWRDLVSMTADFAFETDAAGRFVFVTPDPALGWSAAMLIGQPAQLLLSGPTAGGFDPFQPEAPLRRRRAWLKRPDGTVACLLFAAAPILDEAGHIIGARGLGVDLTEQEAQEVRIAAALRRGEVLDHILQAMRAEVFAPRMMRVVLDALVRALGAEGAAVIDFPGDALHPALLYQSGGGAAAVLASVARLTEDAPLAPQQLLAPDGRPLLVARCCTRFGEQVGLALWRIPGARAWDLEERMLVGSASAIVRVVLEHDAIQRELVIRARTDPLTGLLNRRAFHEEIMRHVERLEREGLPGTLMFIDLDHFKQVNDRFGHETGDTVLRATATLLRDLVRPSDLVARLGGDEFAVWMNGADHLTAAERAEWLRIHAPPRLAALVPDADPPVSLSIGLACREAGADEDLEGLLRRADAAMYAVKQGGRGHWRVAPPEAFA